MFLLISIFLRIKILKNFDFILKKLRSFIIFNIFRVFVKFKDLNEI